MRAFKSKLAGWEEEKKEYKSIDPLDYDFGKSVFDIYCQENGMLDYRDLYLKTDVLLSADVVEECRILCHKHFGLDPLNYFTAPGFSWDCLLKYSGAKLEALWDEDVYLFFEQGIRRGYSNCQKKL